MPPGPVTSKTSGEILHGFDGLVKLAREGPLGHVGREHVRVRDAVFHFAAKRGKFCQPAHGFGVSAEPRQLVAHVSRAIDAVGFRHHDSRAHHRVQQAEVYNSPR